MSGIYRLRIETLDWSSEDAKISVDKEIDEDTARHVLVGLMNASIYRQQLRAIAARYEKRAEDDLNGRTQSKGHNQ